ncbi:MAG TPA: hypothetical protein VFV46_04800 [Lacibacter sp.]|nr:hypothetical protein [Lacibacter sp.]
MKNKYIYFLLFTAALLYMTIPYFFEKYLFFNELLSLCGFGILAAHRFKTGNETISKIVLALILLGTFHAIISIFRMDSMYYYLRNSVILYSMFTYFIGYYGYKYFYTSILKIQNTFRLYYTIFLLKPAENVFFDRFSISTSLPLLFRKHKAFYTVLLISIFTIIHAYDYESATSFVAAIFLIFVFLSPSYQFFRQVVILGFLTFAFFFIYFFPNFALIHTSDQPINDYLAIKQITASNYWLGLDENSTWRLVLWYQYIVDRFPGNLIGYGFGTPVVFHFPILDIDKLATLPYVIGAHNTFVTLFCRLGILFIINIILLYTYIFKEYFQFRRHYEKSYDIFLFYSFFAFFILCFFNPALETPLHSGGYWLILGLLSAAIKKRKEFFTEQGLNT